MAYYGNILWHIMAYYGNILWHIMAIYYGILWHIMDVILQESLQKSSEPQRPGHWTNVTKAALQEVEPLWRFPEMEAGKWPPQKGMTKG